MLDKLREYKEIIAIVIFFAGGFTYLNTNFPDKDDLTSSQNQLGTDIKRAKSDLQSQVKIQQCLLEKYMLLTQLQMRGYQLERTIAAMSTRHAEARKVKTNDPETWARLSPAMKNDFEDLQVTLRRSNEDLQSTVEEMEQLSEELQMHVCAEVPR